MEDSRIVELYWARNEAAIAQTEEKYGHYCFTVAYNILGSSEDANESVNDAYMAAWNAMPPHRPQVLSVFLGKLTRRIGISRLRSSTRAKRGGGEPALPLEELAECIPDSSPDRCSPEQQVEAGELAAQITSFLGTLPQTEREVFVCRYWFAAGIREISRKFGFSESRVKSMLLRTRERLRRHLSKEGLI